MININPVLVSLKFDIPPFLYWGLLIVLCVGSISLICIKGKKAGRAIWELLLIEYTFFIIYTTLILRTVRKARNWEFTPFWSYERPDLQLEIFINVMAFIPIGFLLGCSFRTIRWWKTLLICGGLSASIEILQFLTRRGFAELDDLIHNTLGGMIGYIVFLLGRYGYEKFTKKYKEHCSSSC